MSYDPEIKYIRKDQTSDNYVCFKHAVQLAMKGIEIEPEIDEYGQSGNDMRSTWCRMCNEERENRKTTQEIYVIKTNSELFDTWQKLMGGIEVISGIVQNDMEISGEQLTEWFDMVEKHKRDFVELVEDTLGYIRE